MRQMIILLLLVNSKLMAQPIDVIFKSNTTIVENEKNRFRQSDSIQKTYASSNFEVSYYRCSWTVNPAVRYIAGNVTSHFFTNATTNTISFDLASQLTVDSVYYHGARINFSHIAPATLQLFFPNPIIKGIKDSTTIFYKGVPANSGFGSFIQTTHAGVPVIWTLSEPYGAKDWWPCRNGLDDKADSIDIIVTCPSAFKTSSNGMLINESNDGIQRTAFYRHRYPIATYLIAFAVTNYTVLNHSVQLGPRNLPMITYCYPESEIPFQQNTIKVLDALQLYHQYFGDYPFINERYGHTQFSWGGGMEHQTNSFIVSTDENLMAHELAHQWFGDKVTCGSWQDIWLNEGFATYLSYFYFEKKDPAGQLTRFKNLSNYITNSNNGSVWVNDTNNVNRIFDGRLSYYKGAYLVHMLRWVLGDNIFFSGIQEYMKDPKIAYGFARTDDLKRNLEKISGKSLSEFFKDWYTGEGHPSYFVKWSINKNNWAKINVSQMPSHISVSFFEMPLALKFKKGVQEKTVVVNNTNNNQIFWEDIGFAADTVLIDPDYWVLSRNNSSTKEGSSSIINDIKVFPIPATTGITVSIKNPGSKKMFLHIFMSNGQLISRQELLTPGRDEEFSLNVSPLSRGIYLLRFESDSFQSVKKIVIR